MFSKFISKGKSIRYNNIRYINVKSSDNDSDITSDSDSDIIRFLKCF